MFYSIYRHSNCITEKVDDAWWEDFQSSDTVRVNKRLEKKYVMFQLRSKSNIKNNLM